jgi:hypothetical protein
MRENGKSIKKNSRQARKWRMEVPGKRTGKLKKLLSSMSTAALLVTGCVPKMHTTAPSVEGVVIDVGTGLPVASARFGKKIMTDAKGHFLIAAEKELGIGTPIGGIWEISRSFTVRKQGYLPMNCSCTISNTSAGCRNVVIGMIPVSMKIRNTREQSAHSEFFTCMPFRQL